MGYMKSGSQKSLAAGGISALVLYFVHTQLPVRPVFASSIGLGMQNLFFSDPLAIFFAWKFDQPGFLTWHHCWFRVPGISAALLSVMGSRFKKSRKIFPAGVVSLVSLVMVGGYFHGILRSSHAWCSQLQSHHLRFTLQSLLSFLFHHAISLPFGVLESYGTVSVSSCTGFEQAFCVHVEVGFVFYFVALVSVFVDVCLISDLHYRIVNPLS